MFFSICLAAWIALPASVHSAQAGGSQCVQEYTTSFQQYSISSQADFDAITPCFFLGSHNADGDVSSPTFSAINGDINIEDDFTGALDFGNISAIMGAVRAADASGMLGIEGQNLRSISAAQPSVDGLDLQNLSSLTHLELPALNFTPTIYLAFLSELHRLSFPAFADYSPSAVLGVSGDGYHSINLTIQNTALSLVESMAIQSMDSITITNNKDLGAVDLSTVSGLKGNLTLFNNGPSFSLDVSKVTTAVAVNLSNVDSVKISSLQKVGYDTQFTNNTFTSINTISLESFGTVGLLISNNENLMSLDMGSVFNRYESQNAFLDIHDNPQLVLTDNSFSTLMAAGNITINATISG